MRIPTKRPSELAHMRRAGQIVAEALRAMEQAVAVGVTTRELDEVAEAVICGRDATPSFKGYMGYPATICASINEEIVHGIPGERRLRHGDIISLDVGAICEGYQGDAAITLAVPPVDPQILRLLAVTQDSLKAGIEAAQAGSRLGDISHAIERVAVQAGFDVVREYGGHGIGREMHEPPRVPNWGQPDRGPRLKVGMTLALEPMLTVKGQDTRVLGDHWTVVTANESLSAHFEHTIAVTENGAEILTRLDAG